MAPKSSGARSIAGRSAGSRCVDVELALGSCVVINHCHSVRHSHSGLAEAGEVVVKVPCLDVAVFPL